MANTRIRLSSNFIAKLLASYLLIILIPLAVVGVLYVQASAQISRQNKQFVSEQAVFTRTNFESSVVEINRLLNALLSDEDILPTLYGQNPLTKHERTYSVLQLQRRLYTLSVTSPLYSDILLYNRTENYMVTSDCVYLRMELFPASYTRNHPGYHWNETFFQLLEETESTSERWLIYPSDDGKNSLLLRVAPLSRMGSRVFVILPVDMQDLLKNFEPEYSGSLVALDAQGRFMSGNADLWNSLTLDEAAGTAAAADGRRFLYSDSPTICGIRLIHLRLSSTAEESASALRTSFILLLLFGALSSIAIGLVMIVFQTRPLYRILEMLFGNRAAHPSAYNWKILSERIEQLIQDNQSLTNKRQRQLLETRRYMLNALLCHTSDPDSVVERMERIGLKPRDAFHLITFFFCGSRECSAMCDAICQRFPEAFAHCVVDASSLAVVIRTSDLREADVGNRLRAVIGECERMSIAPPRVAMDPIPELLCVDSCYREQLMTVEIAGEDADGQLLHISNDVFGDQDVFYPAVLEQQITAGILSGSVSQVFTALNVICQENFAARRITDIKSRLVTERLAIALSGALFRLSILPDEIKLNTMQAITRCKHLNDYREFAPGIMEILTPILELIRSRTEASRRPQPGEQILSYLREHLADPGLCLAMLAEHFHLSEGTVSGIIRSETGESYKTYCDRLRIDRACALLADGASVQEACARSGFASDSTFRRTFKKIMGFPPSEYIPTADGDDSPQTPQYPRNPSG